MRLKNIASFNSPFLILWFVSLLSLELPQKFWSSKFWLLLKWGTQKYLIRENLDWSFQVTWTSFQASPNYEGVCVCVCVCVWERERERASVSVHAHKLKRMGEIKWKPFNRDFNETAPCRKLSMLDMAKSKGNFEITLPTAPMSMEFLGCWP